MAISFKEFPWYIQALVFVALAILLIAAGLYVPGLPVSTARAANRICSCRRESAHSRSSGHPGPSTP